MTDKPDWLDLPLAKLDQQQWEALCDGCALCCMHKLEDVDTGDIVYTAVACQLLDLRTCRCSDYLNRTERVAACIDLVPERDSDFMLLPETCAYRRRFLDQALPAWHVLISGDPEAVHRLGVSVRGRAVSESDYGEVDVDAPLLSGAD